MVNFIKIMALLGEHAHSKWQLHETVVARDLKLKATETLSVRDQLNAVLSGAKRGGWGNKKQRTFVALDGGAVDLYEDSNSFGVVVTKQGGSETFAGSPLSDGPVLGKPRFFAFGGDAVPAGFQLQLVRAVTGVDPSLDAATRERRAELWKLWYAKDSAGWRTFNTHDLPVITGRFHELFDHPAPGGGRPPRALSAGRRRAADPRGAAREQYDRVEDTECRRLIWREAAACELVELRGRERR